MNDQKPTFFTSDWHIGHAAILEFDKRPFRDIEHMHRVLINNYNAIVPPHGICYHLGDVGFTNIEKTRQVINSLNGTKVLILGNHDRTPTTMYSMGFQVVIHAAVFQIAQERVTATHCPLFGVKREDVTFYSNHDIRENWHGELRAKYYKFTTRNEGQFHIHGHIHSREGKLSSTKICGRQYDIGAPANTYRPVSLKQLEEWIISVKKGENKV